MIFNPQTLTLTSALMVAMLSLSGCQNTTPVDQQQDKISSNSKGKAMTNGKTADDKTWITADLLARYNWTLVSAADSDNQPITALHNIKDQVRLGFGQQQNENRVSFTVGCNGMSGQVSVINNVMKIADVMSTEMYCDKLNTAENQLAKLMVGDSQLSYKGGKVPVLTQITTDQATLVWQGSMTASAKYGHQGETIFWAVDHQSQPCPDGSSKQCLKVKPISYDDQGVKTAEGEWTLFDGEIEGYTHNEKQDQVLRLKRYVVDPSDVKGKKYAYVLDTVTESTLIQ